MVVSTCSPFSPKHLRAAIKNRYHLPKQTSKVLLLCNNNGILKFTKGTNREPSSKDPLIAAKTRQATWLYSGLPQYELHLSLWAVNKPHLRLNFSARRRVRRNVRLWKRFAITNGRRSLHLGQARGCDEVWGQPLLGVRNAREASTRVVHETHLRGTPTSEVVSTVVSSKELSYNYSTCSTFDILE